MLRRNEDLTRDVLTELMDGKGDVNRTHFLELEEFNGKGRLFAQHVLAPGHSIGYHEHDGEQEAYVILQGRASYSDNGEMVEIGAGDFTLCPSGEGHSIENIGEEDLVFFGLIMNV